jgi:hypothetical protein
MIASRHGRTVQAVARFLTHHQNLEELFLLAPQQDGLTNSFPEQFQCLFSVVMQRIEHGEHHAKSIIPKALIALMTGEERRFHP